ncbi:MAG: ion channel [Pseudomonadota bacterium]
MLPGGFIRKQLPADIRRWTLRFYGRLRSLTWWLLLVLVVLHFSVCYVLLTGLGEHSLADLDVFWYFYVTTATTVGYGDYSPQTVGGRYVTTLLLMPGGILLFTSALAKLAQAFIDQWRSRMKGYADLQHLQDHIVIVGWHGRRSQRMFELLKADPSEERAIVILANLPENPQPEAAYFVASSLLSDPESMRRTGIARAALVIVVGRDDNETLGASLAAGALNSRAHLVSYFIDPAPANILRLHCPQAECIVSMSIENTVRAAQDPGASRLVRQLLSSLEGNANVYRMAVPGGAHETTYWQLLVHLKEEHDATLIAMDHGSDADGVLLNPAGDTPIRGGDEVFLIAAQRLGADQVRWESVLRPSVPRDA